MEECCEKWIERKRNNTAFQMYDYCPECGFKLERFCICEKPTLIDSTKGNWCYDCKLDIKPPKKIEKLVDLNRNIIETQDNEILFDLILEQRFKINEIIDKGREL